MPLSTPLKSQAPFPDWSMSLLIRLYEWAWHLALPWVALALWRKGAKEPLYRQFWAQRFGHVPCALVKPIWVHSASLGEMRGAAPWVQALLDDGRPVLLTTLTPAGRQCAHSLFEKHMRTGQLQLAYAPLELSWVVRRFLRHVSPCCAVMTEIDTWPVMLKTARRCGIPLAIANAQYPKASFERDLRWGGFRSRLFQAYDLVMCKSELQAERFKAVGCRNVAVVGETRFDLPVPAWQVQAAAQTLSVQALQGRPVVCIASAIEGEDDLLIRSMLRLKTHMAQKAQAKPLFVYVPRSPQRFDEVAQMLQASGLQTLRRSTEMNPALHWQTPPLWDQTDVLLGDSLGEMYFYLALSQVVVVGSSFGHRAVHNIIEPLAIHKPVWTGPSVRGIEYPAMEALQAGVLHHAHNSEDLADQLCQVLTDPDAYAQLVEQARRFNLQHAGSTIKHMKVFLPWLASQ